MDRDIAVCNQCHPLSLDIGIVAMTSVVTVVGTLEVTLFIGKDTGHTWPEVLRAIPRAQTSLLISRSRCHTMPSLPMEAR